jgi:hypothetical protein
MSAQPKEVSEAWAWLCEAASSVRYGEASVKFVVHGGRVVRVERALIERKMPAVDGKEIQREEKEHDRKS